MRSRGWQGQATPLRTGDVCAEWREEANPADGWRKRSRALSSSCASALGQEAASAACALGGRERIGGAVGRWVGAQAAIMHCMVGEGLRFCSERDVRIPVWKVAHAELVF